MATSSLFLSVSVRMSPHWRVQIEACGTKTTKTKTTMTKAKARGKKAGLVTCTCLIARQYKEVGESIDSAALHEIQLPSFYFLPHFAFACFLSLSFAFSRIRFTCSL
ncbi:hypothetical protein GQ42DRAFT_68508 [Ramicandelaber brevisporus]|nr:hypothetical protein GQ42DRAFT_68508 [Ramicandelaber brevisporus]